MHKFLFYTTISVLVFFVFMMPSRVSSPTTTSPNDTQLKLGAMSLMAQEEQQNQVSISEKRSQRVERRRVLPDIKANISL